MRIAFDTNVLLAAFLTRGASSEVLEHCIRFHDVVIGDCVLDEFEHHALRYFQLPGWEIGEALEVLETAALVVEADHDPPWVCEDPSDDHVLSMARRGQAVCLLTGDAELIEIGRHEGIEIIPPSRFWRFEKSQNTH